MFTYKSQEIIAAALLVRKPVVESRIILVRNWHPGINCLECNDRYNPNE